MTKWIPAVQSLRPVLDMYLDSSVAVVGCHSGELSRNSCELDILVVGNDTKPATSVKLGGTFMDLFFIAEKDAMKPRDPEHAVALASARPVRDASMVLSAGSSAAQAMLSESCKKSASRALASALKSLGRGDEALAKGATAEADLWLLAGSYDFARALLYSKEVMPSPSHLFGQMKQQSSAASEAFGAFCEAAGLAMSSRAACASRLEGVSVLRDLIVHGRPDARNGAVVSDAGFQIVRGKVVELGTRIEHAECYSFLGMELVSDLLAIPARKGRRRKGAGLGPDVGSLLTGEERLLGERLAADVGLTRSKETIEGAIRKLDEQVSMLARAE